MLTILQGDWIEQLRTLADDSAQCCVTSPPYWGLRDYGVAGQLGLEKTPEEYVAKLVEGFREVRRVLRDDGSLWLNLGDSYASSQSNNGGYSEKSTLSGFTNPNTKGRQQNDSTIPRGLNHGLKAKDLVGIPWRVAFALQADGWWLRSDIIWAKPNPMPESVTDRPTKSHEYIFLMTKAERYFYDAEAIKEPSIHAGETRTTTEKSFNGQAAGLGVKPTGNAIPGSVVLIAENRNKRSVWSIPSGAYPEAHFATFPPDLIKPCILAGSKSGDVVLDPFGGSGTTGQVAIELGRKATLIELNPKYIELIENRCNVTPGFQFV